MSESTLPRDEVFDGPDGRFVAHWVAPRSVSFSMYRPRSSRAVFSVVLDDESYARSRREIEKKGYRKKNGASSGEYLRGRKITTSKEVTEVEIGMIVRTLDGAHQFLRTGPMKAGFERVRYEGQTLRRAGKGKAMAEFEMMLKLLRHEPLYVVPPREMGTAAGSTTTYVDKAPTPAQARCPHRIRNRDGSECVICGSRKRPSGRWEYLSERDFHRYTSGRAGGATLKDAIETQRDLREFGRNLREMTGASGGKSEAADEALEALMGIELDHQNDLMNLDEEWADAFEKYDDLQDQLEELRGAMMSLGSCETLSDALANAREAIEVIGKMPKAMQRDLRSLVTDLKEAIEEAEGGASAGCGCRR